MVIYQPKFTMTKIIIINQSYRKKELSKWQYAPGWVIRVSTTDFSEQ